jgi:hypothetical protein
VSREVQKLTKQPTTCLQYKEPANGINYWQDHCARTALTVGLLKKDFDSALKNVAFVIVILVFNAKSIRMEELSHVASALRSVQMRGGSVKHFQFLYVPFVQWAHHVPTSNLATIDTASPVTPCLTSSF